MELTKEQLYKGVDFKVRLEPMYQEKNTSQHRDFAHVFAGKKFLTVREDTHEPLGIVSDRYQLVQHKDNIRIAYEAIKGYSENFNIRNVINGGKVFTRFMINTDAVMAHSDETAKILITFQNSYDTSLSWGYALSFLRRVCENLMVGFSQVAGMRVKHLKGKLTPEMLEGLPQHIHNYKNEYVQFYELLKNIPVEVKHHKLMQEKLPEQATIQAFRMFRAHQGKTMWDLYNEYTYYYTRRNMGIEGKDKNISVISQFFLSPAIHGV